MGLELIVAIALLVLVVGFTGSMLYINRRHDLEIEEGVSFSSPSSRREELIHEILEAEPNSAGERRAVEELVQGWEKTTPKEMTLEELEEYYRRVVENSKRPPTEAPAEEATPELKEPIISANDPRLVRVAEIVKKEFPAMYRKGRIKEAYEMIAEREHPDYTFQNDPFIDAVVEEVIEKCNVYDPAYDNVSLPTSGSSSEFARIQSGVYDGHVMRLRRKSVRWTGEEKPAPEKPSE